MTKLVIIIVLVDTFCNYLTTNNDNIIASLPSKIAGTHILYSYSFIVDKLWDLVCRWCCSADNQNSFSPSVVIQTPINMCITFFWTDVNVFIANTYTYNAEIYSYEPENVHVLVAEYKMLHAVLRNMLCIYVFPY